MLTTLQRALLLAVLLLAALPTLAAEPDPTPILRIEPGMHFAQIKRIDVDAAERFMVSAADDKTARVWDLHTGKLLQVLRPPQGEGHEGKLFAVAISPDGEQVAVAGWDANIYLFQRSSGALLTRLRDLADVINHLAFSPDGSKLAVALGEGGIRLFSTRDWQELARDSDYGGNSYSVDFDAQGRVVSTSYDGQVRLYDAGLKLLHSYKTQGGSRPYFARFSPDGKQVAVGFADSTAVEILAAAGLQPVRRQDTQGIDNGNLGRIAWSQDGRRLTAGGRYEDGNGRPLVVWDKGGAGKRSLWRASQNTVMDIKPLKDGGVVYASADPAIGRLDANGQVVWKQTSGVLDYRDIDVSLGDTGDMVAIPYAYETKKGDVVRGKWEWLVNELQSPKQGTANLKGVRQTAPGLNISEWKNTTHPKLNGQPLPLQDYETSHSLAIDAQGNSFALGADWSLRLYGKDGSLRWQQSVPVAWAVNISADDRWVVAALGDGTIRWYEKASGKERLAFYLHPDEKRWVTWTPEGFYAAAEGAEDLIGYHLNRGADQEAEFVGVEQLRQVFARADLVTKALDDDYPQLAQAALEKAGDVRQILQAGLPPTVEVGGGPQQQLKQRSFDLDVTLHDQGGGIGRVEYRVNGEVVNSAAARPFSPRSPAGQQALRRPFSLRNGDNTIEVVAYSKNDKVASKPVRVQVQVDDPVQREPSLYILSIGVSDYRDQSFALKYAADDAVDFAAELQKHGDMFQKVEPKVLRDKDVTLASIHAAFEEMAAKVQPQDVFVLYLAGHGVVADGRYHYVPQDVVYENSDAIRQQALGEEKLRDWLSLVEAGKRVMVIDTCHAGKSLTTLAALDTPAARGMDDKAAIDRLMQATGTSILAAASSQQQALEGIAEGGQGHGLFTHVLLKGLQGKADLIKDGTVNVGELQAYARDEVPRLSKQQWQYEQFPMFQLNGQDFPLAQVK
ncbi:caspase family protein [Thiothrix unzii]|uniref:Caspase family protein n=1 Tax=Thiothrix unzii TaxID=111769 RepID=A0A975FBT6_9GAMM|nr:caspase family protein [Thiothrix unzii]QTR54942.1 caspase family protein [Thiothrix unzii]